MDETENTIPVIDAIAAIEEGGIITPSTTTDLKRKMLVKGKVSRIELYGAFIDLGLDSDALIHISQLGKKRVNRVSDVLEVGEEVTAWVDRVDTKTGQVSLTRVKPRPVDWQDLAQGQAYAGTITRLERFGAFIEIGAEKEGLVHVSELSHDYVRNPSQAVRVGERVNVKVLDFSKKKHRINLSIKALQNPPETEDAVTFVEDNVDDDEGEAATSMEIALRRAMGKEPSAQDRSASARRGRKRKAKLRQQQEDILSKTLAQKIE